MNNVEENKNENLKEEIIDSDRESKDTVALNEIPEDQLEKRSCLKRTFGKMNPGSLRGSIFNLCILSLGTGLLAIPQKIGYMSIILSPIIIILSGLANFWSLNILVNMSLKFNLNTYESIVDRLLGNKISLFLGIIMSINQIGIIILYQVILYKLLGGAINEIGGLGYKSVDDFATNSFWKKLWIKFVVCYGIAILLLTPLCLLHNASKMRYASTFGIISLFLLIIIVVAECPFYIKEYIHDDNVKLNYFDIISGLKGDMKLLQSIITVFYAFSCHTGAFPVLSTLHNPTEKRQKKVIRRAIYIDIISYLIIGASGYLTQPINTPDLIIERNKLFKSDWIMTIGEVCFILTLLAKISANYNALRSCIIVLIGKDPSNFTKKLNLLITIITLVITTLIASVFQSISDYISLIGSFCTVLISFFIPGLIYIKGNDYPIKNYKNILTIIFISLILILGLTSGAFTIKGIINKNT